MNIVYGLFLAILEQYPDLHAGLPADRVAAITALFESGRGQLADLLRWLTWITWLRAETGRGDADLGFEAVGYRRDVILSIANGLLARVEALGTARDPKAVVGQMRTDVRSLSKMLREAGSHLAIHVEADFAEIDRPAATIAGAQIERLKQTFRRVVNAAKGKEPTTDDTASAAEAAVVRGKRRAQLALYLLAVDSAADQLDALIALGDASEAIVRPGVELFGTTLRSLAALVESEASLRVSAKAAVNIIEDAEEQESVTRAESLLKTRSLLDRMRAGLVEDLRGRAGAEPAQPTAATGPRVAALSAALLSIDDVPADPPTQKRAFDLISAHVRRGLSEVAAPTSLRTAAEDALDSLSDAWLKGDRPEQIAHATGLVADAVEGIGSEAASLVDDADTRAVAALSRTTAFALKTSGSEDERLSQAKAYVAARKAEVSPAVLAMISAKKDLPSLKTSLRGPLEHIAVLPGIIKPIPDLVPTFPLAPDPSDGIFGAGVGGRLSIAQNRIASALVGASILGHDGHVAAEAPPAGPLAVEVLRNEIRECGAGAIDVVLPDAAAVVIAHNHITACADLAAADTAAGKNLAPERVSGAGQAVVRAAGKGDLFVLENLLYGNGHGHARAVLHEIYLDYRGDVVVRGNVVRHTGGGEGGAGLIVVVEDVASSLVSRLSRQPALDVERPPSRPTAPPPLFYLPWKPLAELPVLQIKPVTTPAYVNKAQAVSKSTLVGHLLAKPLLVLGNWTVPARRSVHVEGNRLTSAGPALLVIGSGDAVVSATVVGNELRSARPTGAAYLRHTDATVFCGNHCECAGVVTVVVLRPDRAPVSVTGNVVLGSQPPRQPDRVVQRQTELSDKLFGKAVLAQQLSPVFQMPTFFQTPPVDLFSKHATAKAKPQEAPSGTAPAGTPPGAVHIAADLPLSGIFPGINLPRQVIDLAQPQKPVAKPPVVPIKPLPQPASYSLVVLGGTNVATVGNATTAGTLVVDAADHTSLDR